MNYKQMSFSEKKGDQEGKGPAGSKTVFSDPQAWTRLKVPEGYTEKKNPTATSKSIDKLNSDD